MSSLEIPVMSQSKKERFNFSTKDNFWNILLSTFNFLNATTSLVEALNSKFAAETSLAPALEDTKHSGDEASTLEALLEAAVKQIKTSEEYSSWVQESSSDKSSDQSKNISVNSNFLAEIDYEIENIITKPPEPAPIITCNKRFEGTLQHQVVKKPQLQKQLIEYSRNSQQKPDNAIQKLKIQLSRMYECHSKNFHEPGNADSEKIAEDIRALSEMVANLERDRQIKYSKTVLPVKKPSKPTPECIKDTKSIPDEDIKMVQTSYKPPKERKTKRINAKPIGFINLEAVSITRGNRKSLKPVKIEVVTSIANEDILKKSLKLCNFRHSRDSNRKTRLSCK